MKIQVSNWSFTQKQDENMLKQACTHLRGVQLTAPRSLEIVKESVDKRKGVKYVYTLHIDFNENISIDDLKNKNKGIYFKELDQNHSSDPAQYLADHKDSFQDKTVNVIGSGPAGMFAALSLIEVGFNVNLIERGEAIPERHKKVKQLFKEGILDEASNICFGEGGAGTFSDGKLTTRKNHPWIRWVLSKFVEFGGPESILSAGKPHIGSDRLRALTIFFRKYLIERGVKVYFGHCIEEIHHDQDHITQLISKHKNFKQNDAIVWATGHSSRDSYKLLKSIDVPIEPKPFAVGVRIEHKQDWVNDWKHKQKKLDEAADYSVVCNLDDQHSVYSFCMCPGGQIVCSSSHDGYHVVNGMSNYARNSEFANSGLVAKVSTDDFNSNDPLAGLEYQENIERKAYEAVGNNYQAPAQTAKDFLNRSKSASLLPSSYEPNLVPANFWEILPESICENLQEALLQFEDKYPGFAGEYVQLIGTETRTSAPCRIPRNKNGVSERFENFYPCGEGAGYAGGIMSAALDGLHIANCIKEKFACLKK